MGSSRGSESGAKRMRLSVGDFDLERVEKIDLTVVDDLLCLIYSHKKDPKTQIPPWLISQKIRYTDKRGLDHSQLRVAQQRRQGAIHSTKNTNNSTGTTKNTNNGTVMTRPILC